LIDQELFWSYVELWVHRQRFTWKKLADECGTSVSTLKRLRKGGGLLSIEMYNCICSGIGLVPEFTITHNENYGKPLFVAGIVGEGDLDEPEI